MNTACIVQSAKIELFLSIASHLITVLTYRPIRIDRRSSLINADLESSFMIFVFEVFFLFVFCIDIASYVQFPFFLVLDVSRANHRVLCSTYVLEHISCM